MTPQRPGRLYKHERAKKDLTGIYAYFFDRSERAAQQFLGEAEEAFDLILRMPGVGRRWNSLNPALADLRVTSVSRRFRDYLNLLPLRFRWRSDRHRPARRPRPCNDPRIARRAMNDDSPAYVTHRRRAACVRVRRHFHRARSAQPSGVSIRCCSLAASSVGKCAIQAASIRPMSSMSWRCTWSLRRNEVSFIRTSASSESTRN